MGYRYFRDEATPAKVVLGGLCVAVLGAGYATAQAVVPATPATAPAVVAGLAPAERLAAAVSAAGLTVPSTPAPGVPEVPHVSVPEVPGVRVPEVPGVSVPEVPTTTPTVPTISVPTLPTTTIPPPTTSTGQAPPRARTPAPAASAPTALAASIRNERNRIATPSSRRSARTSASRHVARTSTRRRAPARPPAGGVTRTAALAGTSRPPTAPASGAPRRPKPKDSGNPLAGIGRDIPLPLPVPDWSKPIILVLLLVAIWFAVRSRLAARRAKRLEGQRVTLVRDVASMQEALVPEVPARLGGLAVSVAYRPADGPAAGGDFYDVFPVEPGKVAIMLGDVSGHGRPSLKQAALTRYTLRAYAQTGLDPRTAIALAGRILEDDGRERCYATVALGIYDARAGTLTYSLAGHPPPLLLGADAPEPLTSCSSPPIGWGLATGLRQTTVSLPVGSQACFFSDGLVEARCDDGLLGRERLREMLAGLGSNPDAGVLLARVREAANTVPDDMAACLLSPCSGRARARVYVEELELDTEALERSPVARFLEQCRLPAADIASTIELAGAIAASYGSALLRVARESMGVSATVLAAGVAAEAGASAAMGVSRTG